MISVLTGALIWLLSEATKKLSKVFGKTVSIRLVVTALSLIAGVIYYCFTTYNPDLWKQVVTFVSGAFAASQAIRMILDKLLPPTSLPTPPDVIEGY